MGREIPASEVRAVHPGAVGDAGYSNHNQQHEGCQQIDIATMLRDMLNLSKERSGANPEEPAPRGV